MKISRLYIVFAVFGAVITLTLTVDCPYDGPKCYCSEKYVICNDLTEIPSLRTDDRKTNVTTAHFEAGHINTIPANSLPAGLERLTFDNNPLTNISRDAFTSSSSTLYDLTIRHAELTELPDALLTLTNLRSLEIAVTPIEEWDPVILQHLGATVSEITLSNISLTGWPSWFSLFPKLCYINVSDNALKSVPDDAFKSFQCYYHQLYLVNCQLTTIPAKALSLLKVIDILDLSGNKLLEINGSTGMENVRVLRINSVGLTVFPDLSNLTKMRELDMGNNNMSDIAQGRLPPNINSLYLIGNNFHYLPDFHVNVSSLFSLNLDDNQISEVNFDLLPPNLPFLFISNNKINTISEGHLNDSLQLFILDLSYNPLFVISPSAFRRLSHLETLDLSYTRLTEIPTALTSLIRLKLLFVYNTSINCSCPVSTELSLWYQLRSQSLKVYGFLCKGFGDIGEYLSGSC